MSTSPYPPPPENKSAGPLARVQRRNHAITSTDAQEAATDRAHLLVTKQWLRLDDQARREMLRDIKFAHPELWRQIAEEIV
jgi:hypothetical protein